LELSRRYNLPSRLPILDYRSALETGRKLAKPVGTTLFRHFERESSRGRQAMNKTNTEKNQIRRIVRIPANGIEVEGALVIPADAQGIVLFAHGSGSSRHSPRNNFVAQVLHRAGMATLLMDLLTKEEDSIYQNRFDIDLLTWRLERATQWITEQTESKALDIGYFGASTGAAAALQAAATFGPSIGSVVSRGGRPDLAMTALGNVQSPTLLIVGGLDDLVIEFNRRAYEKLQAEKHLAIVPGATHLFEEPGTLQEVASLAADWFRRYLGSSRVQEERPRSVPKPAASS
jgi:putative phosphoribosyl transferase